MPNWCENIVTIKGSRFEIDKIKKAIEEGAFLNSLRPEPDHANDNEKDVMPSWYTWRVENWGTKWEISTEDTQWDYLVLENFECCIEMWFLSAWAPPIEAFAYAIDHSENLDIVAYYFESGYGFAGRWDNGDLEEWEDNFPEEIIDMFGIVKA